MDPEEALIYDEDFDGGDGAEGELEESARLKLFRRFASAASRLKEFIGNMITTAGKVVVTILLGSSGECSPRRPVQRSPGKPSRDPASHSPGALAQSYHTLKAHKGMVFAAQL